MVHVVENCTVNSHMLSNGVRVEVGKFRSEEPLSLWFGNHFLASALQIVTHLHYYFIPSLISQHFGEVAQLQCSGSSSVLCVCVTCE